MSEDTWVPMERLAKVSETSILKMSRLLGGIDREGKPLFGKVGDAISSELIDYCSWRKTSKKARKPRKKTVDASVRRDDYEDALLLVKHFKAVCEASVGALPPSFNWGRSVQNTYKAFDAGWKIYELKRLLDLFFDDTVRSEHPWIFKDGHFETFLSELLRLKAVAETGDLRKENNIVIPKEFE